MREGAGARRQAPRRGGGSGGRGGGRDGGVHPEEGALAGTKLFADLGVQQAQYRLAGGRGEKGGAAGGGSAPVWDAGERRPPDGGDCGGDGGGNCTWRRCCAVRRGSGREASPRVARQRESLAPRPLPTAASAGQQVPSGGLPWPPTSAAARAVPQSRLEEWPAGLPLGAVTCAAAATFRHPWPPRGGGPGTTPPTLFPCATTTTFPGRRRRDGRRIRHRASGEQRSHCWRERRKGGYLGTWVDR